MLSSLQSAAYRFWRRRDEWVRLVRIMDRRSLGLFVQRSLPRVVDVVAAGSTSPLSDVIAGIPCRFDLGDCVIELDGSLLHGAREMYARRVYEAVSGFRIEATDVVLDVGANAGLFSILAAMRGQRVVAVEAQPGFVEMIDENLQRNGVRESVTLVQALVGAQTGVLSRPGAWEAASHTRGGPLRELTMRAVFERGQLDHVDLMKVDIEGAEFALFAGDYRAWLPRVRRIAMEVHPEFGSVVDLAHLLEDEGFGVVAVSDDLVEVAHMSREASYLFAKRRASKPRAQTEKGNSAGRGGTC